MEKTRRLGLPHVYLGCWVEGLHGWAQVER
jgi:hypothetical protein